MTQASLDFSDASQCLAVASSFDTPITERTEKRTRPTGPTRVEERARLEERTRIARIVEYTPYPRRTRDERRRVGFTRDVSPSGMCLTVENPEKPEALLRVVGTDVDGNESTDTLARVAWCEPRSDGRFWLGLDVIRATSVGHMLKVHYTERRQRVAVHT